MTFCQKYLVAGHTHMSCDNVHSRMAKATKNYIYLPPGYIAAAKVFKK